MATAAPGDPGYNGGRWQVHTVSTPGGYAAAMATGALADDGIVRYFVCTLNKVPASA